MAAYTDYLESSLDEMGDIVSDVFNSSMTKSADSSSSSSTSSLSHKLVVKDNTIGKIGKSGVNVGVGFPHPSAASPTVIFLISVGLVFAVGFVIFLYALRKNYKLVKYKSAREIQLSQGEEGGEDGDGEDSTLHFMRLKNSASPPLSQGYPESMANSNVNAGSGSNSSEREREGGIAPSQESDLFFDHPTSRGNFMKIHFQNSDSKYKILEEM